MGPMITPAAAPNAPAKANATKDSRLDVHSSQHRGVAVLGHRETCLTGTRVPEQDLEGNRADNRGREYEYLDGAGDDAQEVEVPARPSERDEQSEGAPLDRKQPDDECRRSDRGYQGSVPDGAPSPREGPDGDELAGRAKAHPDERGEQQRQAAPEVRHR